MKVYKIEFRYFDGSIWSYKNVEITALTKIQLMKAFLNEVHCLHSSDKLQKTAIKEVWDTYKKYIIEEVLNFPIISYL